MGMRNIITFEDNLSFFWYFIPKSFEYICHVCSSKSILLECGKLTFICIFSDLIQGKIKKLLPSSYSRMYNLYFLFSEKIRKYWISNFFDSYKRIWKLKEFSRFSSYINYILTSKKLRNHFISCFYRRYYSMAKYSNNLTISNLH